MDNIVTACLQATLEDPEWRARAIAALPELAIPIARVMDGGHLLPDGKISNATHILIRAFNRNIEELKLLRPADADRLSKSWTGAAQARSDSARANRKAVTPMGMLKSAAGAAASEAIAVAQGAPPVEEHTRRWRLSLCEACPSRDPGDRPAYDRCKECGCFLAAKTAMRTQSCPIGKW